MTVEVSPPVTDITPVIEPPAPAAVAAPAPPAPESVDALPAFAQKMIHDLRSEAAANRTKVTSVEQAQQETMDKLAKALGLKGDDDPAKAAQTAAEERDAAKAVARNLAVENAVMRAASRSGANADALTDSRAFMRALDGIDPAADDFATQLDAAIAKAVEANPSLKAQGVPVAAPARSGGPVGGGAAIPGQLTREDIKGMTPDEILKAKEDGQLNTLLGITT
jgi:hypothetical protein